MSNCIVVGYVNGQNVSFEDVIKEQNATCWEYGNVTTCWDYGNLTYNSSVSETHAHKSYWAFILLIFPFFTVFGNCLVSVLIYYRWQH